MIEEYIRLLFPENHNGCCIDVGASDGNTFTQSFEKSGWDCLCVEPVKEEYEKCRNARRKVVHCAIGEENISNHVFSVFSTENGLSHISSLYPMKRFFKNHTIISREERSVQVHSLSFLLDQLKFSKNIDFISIDINGSEIDVLRGIDLVKYNVKLFLVKNIFQDTKCLEFLSRFGYSRIISIDNIDFFIK